MSEEGDNDSPFVTAKEVAEYFDVSRQTVYNWANSNKIPSYRAENSKYNFILEEVIEAMRNDTDTNTQPFLEKLKSYFQ